MKNVKRVWISLKKRIVLEPILVSPSWKKEFHVHVDASSITPGAVLARSGEGSIEHPIAFSNSKLLTAKI